MILPVLSTLQLWWEGDPLLSEQQTRRTRRIDSPGPDLPPLSLLLPRLELHWYRSLTTRKYLCIYQGVFPAVMIGAGVRLTPVWIEFGRTERGYPPDYWTGRLDAPEDLRHRCIQDAQLLELPAFVLYRTLGADVVGGHPDPYPARRVVRGT